MDPTRTAERMQPGAGRRGAAVRLTGVTCLAEGAGVLLDDLHLDVAAGELLALLAPLAPDGTDGTRVLGVVAGTLRPGAGQVLLDGRDVTGDPAGERDVEVVGPADRLPRHRTVLRTVTRAAGEADRTGELLADLGLTGVAGLRVRRLGPADRRRTALARALAGDPAVLLLDEPLAGLDCAAQHRLREQLRRLQVERGPTTLLATADDALALAVADRVAVLHAGRVEQVGTPEDLYERPATAFVAGAIGTMNRIPAVLGDGDVEFLGVRREVIGATTRRGAATALVRPEALEVEADTRGRGRVVTRTFSGATTRLAVALPGGREVQADVPGAADPGLTPGTAVTVTPAERPALVEPAGEVPGTG